MIISSLRHKFELKKEIEKKENDLKDLYNFLNYFKE